MRICLKTLGCQVGSWRGAGRCLLWCGVVWCAAGVRQASYRCPAWLAGAGVLVEQQIGGVPAAVPDACCQ